MSLDWTNSFHTACPELKDTQPESQDPDPSGGKIMKGWEDKGDVGLGRSKNAKWSVAQKLFGGSGGGSQSHKGKYEAVDRENSQ